jgi:hypothetical protein
MSCSNTAIFSRGDSFSSEWTWVPGAGVYTVEQYVTGSLWGDRLKLGSLTAKYYYARI